LRHGFKAEAEKRALAVREALGIGVRAALNPWDYARHLAVRVLNFDDLEISDRAKHQLTHVDRHHWSVLTLKLGKDTSVVVNPQHSPKRQRSDLLHELAHIELCHPPARVEISKSGLIFLGDHSREQEEEAKWLGTALLLPRDGILQLQAEQKTITQIAALYKAPSLLCKWRVRVLGLSLQVQETTPRRELKIAC